VILAFLRLATSRAAFAQPLTTRQATEKVQGWLGCPVVSIPRETDRHWSVLQQLLAQPGIAGNLTSDAHLAALAISRDAALVSCDYDFARFEALRWENPLST
jgi:hypothetical protein